MITIKHGRATITVKPEHAQITHDLLALIDKTKGKRGVKLDRPKGEKRRDYPQFNPAMMLTSDYVTAYTALNHKRFPLMPCAFKPGNDRTPPMLDPSYPEVVAEVEA